MGFLFRRHDDREICVRCIGKKLLPPKRLSHKHGDFSYLFIYLFISFFLLSLSSWFLIVIFFFHFYSFLFYLNCVAHIYYVLQEKKKIT